MRILIVDDQILFRAGLATLLSMKSGFKVVGQAESVARAVEKARELEPDVVLMDYDLPDGTGVDAMQTILAERPETKVVFLTGNSDEQQLFHAVRHGAKGYLYKDMSADQLMRMLPGLTRGEALFAPAAALRIVEEFARLQRRPEGSPDGDANLTRREREILHMLADGATNQEIARHLVISVNTVKNHLQHIFTKLQVTTRREAAEYACQHGL